jgi:hypothetical protein
VRNFFSPGIPLSFVFPYVFSFFFFPSIHTFRFLHEPYFLPMELYDPLSTPSNPSKSPATTKPDATATTVATETKKADPESPKEPTVQLAPSEQALCRLMASVLVRHSNKTKEEYKKLSMSKGQVAMCKMMAYLEDKLEEDATDLESPVLGSASTRLDLCMGHLENIKKLAEYWKILGDTVYSKPVEDDT